MGAVAVEAGSRVSLEDCQLTSNGTSGLQVQEGAYGEATACVMMSNASYGACFLDEQSSGAVERCDLRGNTKGAVMLTRGALEQNVRRCDNTEA